MSDPILQEAKRLYQLGFAIHWLHNRSKRPVESGWTTGPRTPWDILQSRYKKGLNVGVRLGQPSKINENFLAVIDVDIKSREGHHGQEVLEHLKTLGGDLNLPEVRSGRGNGSRHYYILTPEPIAPFKVLQSTELVRVPMPSVQPSKRELKLLKQSEIEQGLRLRPAWEIALMSDGQQVVLPPSIHPDSNLSYKWQVNFDAGLASGFDLTKFKRPAKIQSFDLVPTEKTGPKTFEGFEVSPVEVSWLPLNNKIKQMILTGEGVEDRSAMLLPCAQALMRTGLTQNEILTVLTDTETFLGKCAYQHAKTSDRARAARWVYNYTLARVVEEAKATNFFVEELREPQKISIEQMAKDQLEFDELPTWQLSLDLTAKDKVQSTLRNVVMILDNEIGEDFVRRDTFSLRDFYSTETPWGGELDHAITDDDIKQLKFWLSNNFGFEPNNNIIGEALTIIAMRNAFDPVVDWLDALPAWDEVPRIDTWLKDHFGAQGNDEYLAQVFRKWLCAMVVRAYEPGAKFDWMPIFEGAQGVGKSSFGRLLCGDKYFLDWLPDLMNKDAALALQGIWSVEMGELASFRKNEIEAVKAFLTRTVDKVRPPYGERWLESKRRCVFFGTTNFETYLRDDSGNRRFKPIKVGKLDFDALAKDRIQLFSEAKWLYDSGFEHEQTLWLTGEAKTFEAIIQSEKMVSDEAELMADRLSDFVNKELAKEEAERFNFLKFKIVDLFSSKGHGLVPAPLNEWPLNARNVQFAGKALHSLGAANWKSDGRKFWCLTKEGGF